jgi:hypothetical protein
VRFKAPALTIAILLHSLSAGFAQGTFQNLNFESPLTPLVVSDPDAHYVTAASALPGWIAYRGTNPTDVVYFNVLSIGSVDVSLLSPGYGFAAPEGSYFVELYPGFYEPVQHRVECSIGQVGSIPSDAASLRFLAAISHQIQVSFAGELLPIVALGPGPNSSALYGIDISAFAGQSGEIRFTAPVWPDGANMVYLDAISFSNQPIPEPSVFGLFGLGALLLGWRTSRQRQFSL